MTDKAKDVTRYLANLSDELNSAALYRALAEIEKDTKVPEVYRRLSATERGHADDWAKLLRDAGIKVPPFRPSWRARTVIWLARRFGVEPVLPTISFWETINSSNYSQQPEATSMVGTERAHGRLLQQIIQTTQGGMAGAALARIEGRHRTAGGNALRAAVLGASDRLLSNFNLIMGAAGAEMSSKTILLTGFAGLLAGAISMALGEWISVQSSRELYQKQISTEKDEIEKVPEEEIEELDLIYQARGLSQTQAHQLATQIMSNRDIALDTLARDELGINPKDLGGSAWEASITSFFLFAIGAIVPVIPYTFLNGRIAVFASAALSAVALFMVGAAITLFTGRSVLCSGMRQVSFGLVAAAIVFLIGHLIGGSFAG